MKDRVHGAMLKDAPVDALVTAKVAEIFRGELDVPAAVTDTVPL